MLIDRFIEAIKPYVDFDSVKVCLDIGSRDLEQSIELHAVFPQAHIHAFEPNPESYDKCVKAAPSYVTVWPYAVLDYNGKTQFYSVAQEDNRGASSIFEPTDNVVGVDRVSGLERIVVPCTRVDSWAKENKVDKIDLVWADCQSAEIPMLTGFGRRLDDVKALATEAVTGILYYGNRRYNPSQYIEVKEFMKNKGFKQVFYHQPWPLEADVVFVRTKWQ